MNPWIAFVKEWVKENNVSYSEAIKDPRVSEAYKRIQRQSSTQQVARNVAQGKLSDIAEKAKAMSKPKPLPKSSAVKAVFDSPYVRSKIMAFKPSIEEIDRRRAVKTTAQKGLSAIAGKQMIKEGTDYEQVYGRSGWLVRDYVKLAKALNLIYDIRKSDDFFERRNDPDEEIEELEQMVLKLQSLFTRVPSKDLFPGLEIDLEDIGIEIDEDEEGEVEYYYFGEDAQKEIQEWTEMGQDIYDTYSPEGIEKRRLKEVQENRDSTQKDLMYTAKVAKRRQREKYNDKLAAAKPKRDATQRSLRNIARVQMRNEAQQRAEANQPIRDTAQAELAALAQAQKPKKPRPAPVRRPKSK